MEADRFTSLKAERLFLAVQEQVYMPLSFTHGRMADGETEIALLDLIMRQNAGM